MSSLSFTKLFSSITDSSVWQESSDVRIVWVTLMAMSDPLGRVHAAIPGLARRANVSREATEQALTVFLSPDPDSRSKDHDGRRIEEIQGGWRLLNYATYREMRDEEARKEKNRIYQERFRSKTESKESKILSDKNLTVRNVRQSKTMSAQEEAEEEVEGESTSTVSSTSYSHPEASLGAISKPHPDLSIYEAYPRKEGKGAAMTSINKAVTRLVKGEAPHAPMVKLDAQRYLMRRVLEYERSPAGRQPDKTKIPHPATWFNQKRYDDDQSNWHHTEKQNGTYQSKSESTFDALKRSIEAGRNQGVAGEDGSPETGEDCGVGVRGLLGGPDALRPADDPHGAGGIVIEASR